MSEKRIRSFIYLSIIIYIIILIITSEVLQSISTAVTVTFVIRTCYYSFLWRFNPLEKTPRIYGKYSAPQQSSFQHKEFTTNVTIRQTLNRITVTETYAEAHYESLTAELICTNKTWSLIYTYSAQPTIRFPDEKPDEPHHGTCILRIVDRNQMVGSYFTDRHKPTLGKITLNRLP